MEAQIRDEIKQKLMDRKAILEAELAKIAHKDEHGVEATYEDRGDDEDVNAQEVADYSDRLSLVEELSKNLKDVEASLKKMEDGTYGVCKYCQKEINPQRLLARPSSGSCVDCKATLQGENR